MEAVHTKRVLFSDALSVIQALLKPRNKDLRDLASALHALRQSTEKTVIKWIPSHYNIPGNEEAERLAKEEGTLLQEKQPVSYEEAKTMVKEKQRGRWLQQRPDFNSRDSSYQLSREDQVIIMRLRTGHSRPRHNMFTKFRNGESSAYHCGASLLTMEHFLQDCQNHQNLRAEMWRGDTLVREKIYGLWRTFNVWRHMSELLEFLSDER